MTSTEIKTIELIVNSEQAKKRLDDLGRRLTTLKQKREEALNKGDSKGLQVYSGKWCPTQVSCIFVPRLVNVGLFV